MGYLPQRWRYLGMLVASFVVAIWVAFFLISPEQAVSVIRKAGYWLMAGTVGLFALVLYQYLRTVRESGAALKTDWIRWGMVGAAVVLFQIHEPHGFKIIMDELVLGATSMSMHMDREVFCALQIHNFDGADLIFGGVIDKRPYFFAFLLSLFHDVTGYRPENAFVLNAILSFVLLGLVGHFAALLSNRNGGRLAVMLLAGLPLLAINATGGGFEILNLCMITTVMLAAISFLERKDAVSLNLLIVSGVLLAQTRYESVLFIFPIGLVIVLGWWRMRLIRLTLPVILAPLLLVPYPLINSIFRAYRTFWQLPDNLESPFSLEFLPENLSHAVVYLFEFSPLQSNSVLLSYLGIVALVFFILFFIRRVTRLDGLPAPELVVLLFGVTVLANFLLLMCYHWGRLDEFEVSRLGLPLMLLMALAIPFVLIDFKPSIRIWNGLVGVACAFFFFVAVPTSVRAFPTERYLSFRETGWFIEFIRAHRDEGAYFVVPSPLPAVILRESTCSNSNFKIRAPEVDYHMKRETYSKIYVFQRFFENISTGELVELENSEIGDEYTLEAIAERKFGPGFRSRISLVTEIDARPREEDDVDELRLIRREINLHGSDDSENGRIWREFVDMLP